MPRTRALGVANVGSPLGGGAVIYSDKVLSYGPIAYWPLWEAAGLVVNCLVNPAQDGTYAGVVLGQPGIGDGNTCPLFDGINDDCDVASAAYTAAFDGAEGSFVIWIRAFGAATWADATVRGCIMNRTATNDLASINKPGVANNLSFTYRSGGVPKTVLYPTVSVNWLCCALTWSALADEMIAYVNGAQTGLIQNGLGVWGGAQRADFPDIGTIFANANVWHGRLAHAQSYDFPLGPVAVADLAVI